MFEPHLALHPVAIVVNRKGAVQGAPQRRRVAVAVSQRRSSPANYALCLYTGVQRTPLTHLTVPANGTKWTSLSTRGYRYRDTTANADGVTKLLLRGGDAGKSIAAVRGKGMNLPDPTFSNLPLPVTAQLVNSQTSTCFEAIYGAADLKKNDAGKFKAITQP